MAPLSERPPAPGAAALDAPAGAERERAFLTICAILFALGAWGTIAWCSSMSGGMPMRGGWTMSMAWMRMPDQTWPGAAASFLGMWIVMMIPMMLPSLVPMLLGYRRFLGAPEDGSAGVLTALAGAAYFFVWTVFGAAAYPIGLLLAGAAMRWPFVAGSAPVATGLVLVFAGCLQLTPWKSRQLSRCREAPGCGRPLRRDAASAWRHGLRLGVHCCACCLGFMAILLAEGVMDLGVMAAVAAAITLERLAPRPESAARALGVAALAAGVFAIARSLRAT